MEIFTAEVIGTAILIIFGDGVVAGVLLSRSKAENAGWIVRVEPAGGIAAPEAAFGTDAALVAADSGDGVLVAPTAVPAVKQAVGSVDLAEAEALAEAALTLASAADVRALARAELSPRGA